MTRPAITLRVFHPSIDPREITGELGLPPTTSWQAGGEKRETCWQSRLAGDETGHGDLSSALRDIAARFEHYRFFVDRMCGDGGRVEIFVAQRPKELSDDLLAVYADLKIDLAFAT